MKPRYEQPGHTGETTFTCYVRRARSYEFVWHYHREYELTLITEGTGTRYVGTTIEHYEPGDLVLLGPDLPHTYASSGEGADTADSSEAVVTQFRHEFLGADFFALPQFRSVDQLLARSVRGLRFGRPTDGSTEDVRALLTRVPGLPAAAQTVALLDVLQRLATDATATPMAGHGHAPASAAAMSERIDTVCRYLQRAHTEPAPLRLADVAALAHMSPTSFSRFFSRAMGRTLTDYVNQLRVDTACALLVSTDLPVIEVAARSGYRNLSNFNRRFRELKGLRPTQYRNLHA